MNIHNNYADDNACKAETALRVTLEAAKDRRAAYDAQIREGRTFGAQDTRIRHQLGITVI